MARLMLPKTPDKASFGVKSRDKESSRIFTAEEAIVTGWRESAGGRLRQKAERRARGKRRHKKDRQRQRKKVSAGLPSCCASRFSGGPKQRNVAGVAPGKAESGNFASSR